MGNAESSIGTKLLDEFDQVKRDRSQYEEEWLDAASLNKYGLLYADSSKDSRKIAINLVRTKIKAISARLLDFLHPASGELSFSVSHTPVPTMSEAIKNMIMQEVSADGIVSQHEIDVAVRERAEKAATEMQTEIADQLIESPGKIGFREVTRRIINSGLIYGTGVLKGPLVTQKTRKRWTIAASDDYNKNPKAWDLEDYEGEITPYFEAVSLWSFYPDMGAVDAQLMRFTWQKHMFSRSELLDLANKDKFNGAAIRSHILENKDGDSKLTEKESRLRELAGESVPVSMKGFYDVYERWGYLTGKDLLDCGVTVSGDPLQEVKEYASNVWLLGNKVIKAVIAPVNGVPVPYYMWHYNKDETSIFGTGIPEDIKTLQLQINKAADDMMDNADKSCGPQIGLNMSALNPSQWSDTDAIKKNKVWKFSSAEEMDKLMKIWTLPNYASQYQALISFLQNFIDEMTAPRFISGDGRVPGAGDTASGLSMLMGAMHINLKEPIKSFDDNIITPFITACYHWNMVFNPKESIKGDFDIIARGSSSLIQKEVLADQLIKAIEISNNPRFEGRMKDEGVFQQLTTVLDIPADIVRTDEEFAQYQTETAARNANAQIQAIIDQMESRGVDVGLALSGMLQQAYSQQQAQAPQQQQEVIA